MEPEEKKLQTGNHTSSPMNLALYYLKFRPRTVWEMRQYLTQKDKRFHWGDQKIEDAIRRLLELSLLDDVDFIHRFVQTNRLGKKHGRRWFVQKLLSRGIARSIVDEHLPDDQEREQEEAYHILIDSFGAIPQPIPPALYQKAQRKLLSRGYGWSNVLSALARWKKTE